MSPEPSSPAAERKHAVTVYRGAAFPEPIAQESLSWPEVVAELRAALAEPAADKTSMLAWAPHALREPLRKAANVTAVSLLVIDIDRCELAQVEAALEYLECAALVYGSPSDDASGATDARRVRVVAPIDRDLDPELCPGARYRFAEALGLLPGSGPEGAHEAAKLFFVGRLEGTPERYVREFEGPPIVLDELLELELEHAWSRPRRPAKAGSGASAATPRPVDAAPIVALLWDEYDAGSRRELIRALGGYLARRGWSDEQLEALAEALPSDQKPARRQQIVEAARQARRGEITAGWGVIAARLDDADAKRFEALARDPREPAGFDGIWSEWWAMYLAARAEPAELDEAFAPVDADAPGELLLDTTRQGVPRPTHANAIAVLEHVFGDRLRYDDCSGRVVVAGVHESVGRFPCGDWTDVHTTAFVVLCERMQLRLSPSVAHAAIVHHAKQHSFNPLREGLVEMAATWDGTSRVDDAMTRYWGAPRGAASNAVARVFLLSLAARGLEPGCKVDTCPMLIGAQGARKSTSLEILAGVEHFADSPLPIGDKDALENLRGVWLWELGENSSVSTRDRNVVKAFLSARRDRFRASYGRFSETVPRATCFAISTNDERTLTDPTGNRRFMPVIIGTIDVEALRRDREQLLGEAARRVLDGEQHWPTREEEAALEPSRENATEEDPWEELIGAWIGERERITTSELFDSIGGALDLGARVTKGDQRRAGAALSRLGWRRQVSTNERGERVRGWVRATA